MRGRPARGDEWGGDTGSPKEEAGLSPSGLYARRSLMPGSETAVGALLAERRAGLIADLGGDPSTAQLALVDLAVRSWALLDAADSYLSSLPSWVDRRHRSRLAAPGCREEECPRTCV